MSDLALLKAVLVVVEAAVVSVLLPPVAWLVAKTWRRSAAGRRLVWITAFAMLLGLPLLAMAAPSLAVIAFPPPPPADLAAAPAVIADASPRAVGFSWSDLIPVAVAVWLAGVAKLGVQHLVALVRLELMRRAATPWRKSTPVPVRGCALLVSEECPGPITWGAFRPVILLPDEALDWAPDRLETVLRHELAHVRRRDGLAQALALVACALYWPNPLVWAAARALRREAELAADDTVIASGVRPSDYAAQLLELAAEWRERRLTPTGLAMAAPPALSQRVQSILSTDAIRTGATAMDAFKLVLLGGAATAALTLARPSVAEVPAPPAPPAAPSQAEPAAPAPPAAPAEAPKSVRYRDKAYRFTERRRDGKASDSASGSAGANAGGDVRVQAGPNIKLAQQDVPAPPAPPAVSAAPLPPAPPAQALPPAPRDGGWDLQWLPSPGVQPPAPPAAPAWPVPPAPRFREGRVMTPEQRAELDRRMAAIGPAIDKAIKDAHIDETVQRALSAQDAKTREEVARQLQQIGPRIQQAIEGAHIQELVQQRLAQLQPQIEQAMRENMQKARERQAQAEERVAQQLEEQAKRARERAQRDREQLNAQAPQPAQPKN